MDSYNTARKKFGRGEPVKPMKLKGYWENHENFRRVGNRIIKKYGFIPGSETLRRDGYGYFVSAARHYGGLRKAKKKFGWEKLAKPRKPPGYWKSKTDAELVDIYKNKFISISPSELRYTYGAYYNILKKRKILQRLWGLHQEYLERQLLRYVSKDFA